MNFTRLYLSGLLFAPGMLMFAEAPPGVYVGTDKGLISSADAGRTWHAIPALGDVTVLAVGIDPSNSRRIFAATKDGVYQSSDGATTWERSAAPEEKISAIRIDPAEPNRVYAAGDQLWISTDGGQQWRFAARLNGRIEVFEVDPVNPSTLYAAAGIGLYISEDHGSTWNVVTAAVGRFALNVVNGRTVLYAGYASGLLRSSDGGRRWELVTDGPAPQLLCDLAGINWSGDCSVFRPAISRVISLAVDPKDAQRAFMIVEVCVEFIEWTCSTGEISWTGSWKASRLNGTAAVAVDQNGVEYVAGRFRVFKRVGDTLTEVASISATAPVIAVDPTHAQVAAIRNAAADVGFATGTIVSIFGSNLSRGRAMEREIPAMTLADAEVLVNGTLARLYFASPEQINAYLPLGIEPGTAIIEVRVGGRRSAPRSINLLPSAPALFTQDGSGSGDGVIVHATTMAAVSSSTPGIPGEAVIAYGTGIGIAKVITADIGGAEAEVESVGSSGLPGIFAIRVRLPDTVRPGTQLLRVFGGQAGSNSVAMQVQ